jgi:hypothetical protein
MWRNKDICGGTRVFGNNRRDGKSSFCRSITADRRLDAFFTGHRSDPFRRPLVDPFFAGNRTDLSGDRRAHPSSADRRVDAFSPTASSLSANRYVAPFSPATLVDFFPRLLRQLLPPIAAAIFAGRRVDPFFADCRGDPFSPTAASALFRQPLRRPFSAGRRIDPFFADPRVGPFRTSVISLTIVPTVGGGDLRPSQRARPTRLCQSVVRHEIFRFCLFPSLIVWKLTS